MPELPEVETIRRDLQRVLRRKTIAHVQVGKPKVVRNSVATFKKRLTGATVTELSRRGKLLIIHLDTGHFLLVHLKMTGQLIYVAKKKLVAGGHPWPLPGVEVPNKYTHVTLTFADGSTLYFNDLRQFGFMRVVDVVGKETAEAAFGIEPGRDDFTLERFSALIRKSTAPIKVVLLDQKRIAGLGNIYVDEACFLARVLPTRRANSLTQQEIVALYTACQTVITRAIEKRGTTFGSYRDGLGQHGAFVRLLKVYGRGGEQCKRCKETLVTKVKLAGRGTHYCAGCQG